MRRKEYLQSCEESCSLKVILLYIDKRIIWSLILTMFLLPAMKLKSIETVLKTAEALKKGIRERDWGKGEKQASWKQGLLTSVKPLSPFEVLERWIGTGGKDKRRIVKATSTEYSWFRKEYGWHAIPFWTWLICTYFMDGCFTIKCLKY